MADRSLLRALDRVAVDPSTVRSPLRALAGITQACGPLAARGDDALAGRRRRAAARQGAALALRIAVATGVDFGDALGGVRVRLRAAPSGDIHAALRALGAMGSATLALGDAADGEGWEAATIAFAGPQALDELRTACVDVAAAILAAADDGPAS